MSALDGMTRVTYRLEQGFRYAYDAPVSSLRHRLRVVPPASHGPAVRVSSRLVVHGAEVRRRSSRDSAGNTVVRVTAEMVHEGLEFDYTATVSYDAGLGPVLLAADALGDPRYRRPTALTGSSGELAELAGGPGVVSDRAGTLDLADRLCARVHGALAYEWGVTGVRTTAAEALVLGRGVCQDSAHVMLALCHVRGVPARYVSGHLVGQGGTHAWVEVLVPTADGRSVEAVGFDPCNGRRTGPGYLTIATGRDYRDVAPTSGTYVGRAQGRLTTRRELTVLDAA